MDAIEAAKLMGKNLESRELNLISSWLRQEESAFRVSFLIDAIGHTAIWRLATSTINDRREALEIYKLGLDRIHSAHSQLTMKWVKFGVTKLGPRRAIAEIAKRMDSQPYVVDMALYWLPSLIGGDRSGCDMMKQLQAAASEAGIIRPVRSEKQADGSVLFRDRYEN
ncbi:hypothetical protein [Persicirhabdus sediminis]|uniref:Uncharacterized protein n=1 Tax=Persicirhabdus sediminis TaxID=454144 RepID=A0A8J7MAU9_9BACT|nr:hypothetical protein [Persicirhabdus sediminis]MBK1790052.1 hypothetical protein [Persicirhabdus sediminis]